MHRIFLALAVTVGTLLLTTFVLGFAASFEDRARGHFWRDVHFLLGLTATMATLLVHSIVYTYLLGTGKWVREVVRVYRLPDWVEGMAIRNKRRTFPFALWGMLLAGGAAWLLVEYGSVVAQVRLLLEVKDQADRLRNAQLAAAGLAADRETAHGS
jgi:hypothetical protein